MLLGDNLHLLTGSFSIKIFSLKVIATLSNILDIIDKKNKETNKKSVISG